MKKYLETVRNHCPLVHNITNYVTVNDVANIILACGASPIMADDPEEVQEITTICQGLNINIGTLHKSSIESMFLAGKKANELGHPVHGSRKERTPSRSTPENPNGEQMESSPYREPSRQTAMEQRSPRTAEIRQ